MSFNVSGMEEYIKQNPDVNTQAITSSQTVKTLLDAGSVQAGVKGSAAVTSMDTTPVFTDGASCSRTASDTTSFSQRTLVVKRLHTGEDLCLADLDNTVMVEAIKGTQGDESLDSAVSKKVIDHKTAKLGAELEKAIWQGDTGGAGNLQWFDGFLKLITDDGEELTLVGDGIIAQLQSAVAQVAIAEREQADFRVFMGQDVANALKLAVFNGKYFNPDAADEIPGTGAKFQIASGLNTTDKIVLARMSNLRFGMDGTGDFEKIEVKSHPINKSIMMDFYFTAGCQVVFPDVAYWAAVDTDESA